MKKIDYENWYTVKKINENFYILREKESTQHGSSFLFLGKERAFVIDTGSGENAPINGTKMMYQINKLNKKNVPVTLLLTHFHFGHCQNAEEFDNIAFPKIKMLENRVKDGIFKFTKKDLFLNVKHPNKIKVSEWLPLEKEIDLGGLKLEIVHTPGHAPEYITIIDRTNKIAITGDLVYNWALMIYSECYIKDYVEGFKKFLSKVGKDYRFFGSHMEPEVSYERILKSQSLINEIAEGTKPKWHNKRIDGMKWDAYEKDEVSVYVLKKSSWWSKGYISFIESLKTHKH